MTAHGDPPLVTIGLSTFERADDYLPEALQSALAQAYPKLEVIACDNASRDGTAEYLAGVEDSRLRVVRHDRNIGPNANFNACLERASGRYFLLLHDDDVLHPTFIARAVAALDGREPGVLLSGAQVIDAQGRVLSRRPAPAENGGGADLLRAWFERRIALYLCSTLFHTERLRAAGGFASPANLLQDVRATTLLAARHGFVSVPGLGGAFRRHGANRGGAAEARAWRDDALDLLDVVRRELPDHAAELEALGRPYLAQKCYRYVEGAGSWRERWQAYRDIDRAFGGAYAPWRFVAHRARLHARKRLGAWWRAARGAARAPLART